MNGKKVIGSAIKAILMKKFGLVIGGFLVNVLLVGSLIFLPLIVVAGITPAFTNGFGEQDAAYIATLQKYTSVQTQLVNEKQVNFPIEYVMALDMFLYENDFSKANSADIKKKAERFIKTEPSVDSENKPISVNKVMSEEEMRDVLKKDFPTKFDKTNPISKADQNYEYVMMEAVVIREMVFSKIEGGTVGGNEEIGDIVQNGKFIVPMDGKANPRVTAGWGLYDPYDNGHLKFHQAVDWAGIANAKIIASAEGTVKKVVNTCVVGDTGCGNGFGNQVLISHVIDGKEYETMYGHFQSVSVAVGQKVKQAEVIGIQGNTGASNGAHVHFELHTPKFNYRIDNNTPAQSAIDPLTVIKIN